MSQKLFFKNTISNPGKIQSSNSFKGNHHGDIRLYKQIKDMLRWLLTPAVLELGRETEGIRDEITLSGLVLSQEKAVESM